MNMHIPSRQNIFCEMRDYLMIALGMIMYGIDGQYSVSTILPQAEYQVMPHCIFCNRTAGTICLFRHQLPTVIACYPYFRMEVQHQDNFCRFYS